MSKVDPGTSPLGMGQNLYHIWLVVEPPLWKIWLGQLGWWHSQLNGKSYNSMVPNHHPDIYPYFREEHHEKIKLFPGYQDKCHDVSQGIQNHLYFADLYHQFMVHLYIFIPCNYISMIHYIFIGLSNNYNNPKSAWNWLYSNKTSPIQWQFSDTSMLSFRLRFP